MALILASDECSSKSLDDDIPNVIGRILVHLIFRNERNAEQEILYECLSHVFNRKLYKQVCTGFIKGSRCYMSS